MTRPTARRAVAPLAGLALLLTGCGGGDAPDSAGEKEPELGPLDTYFEQIYGSFDEDQADAQMVEVEEIVAECMREQGFEYTPVDYSGQQSFSDEELDVEWGSKEFAEQYGYGITTNPWGDPAEEPMPEEEYVDPNMEYVESMSDTERQAYETALYGTPPEFEEGMDEAEVEYDWTQAGCQGKAQHEVYESVPGMDEDQMKSLQKEMEAMWEATMDDPRMAEVNASWSECMAEAGYSGLATADDAQNQISEESNTIYEEVYAEAETGTEAEFDESRYAELDAEVQRRMSDLTSREVETAVADFGCREEVGYDDVQQEVSFDHQQQFVDSHKAELEAWAEAAQAEDS